MGLLDYIPFAGSSPRQQITWKQVSARDLPSGITSIVPQTYQASNLPFGLTDTNKPSVQEMEEKFISIFAKALSMRANEAASALLDATVKREEAGERVPVEDDHPWRMLIRRPHPEVPAHRFWKWMHLVRDLQGSANAIIERDTAGVPMWLWPIYPEWGEVKPVLDEKGGVDAYVYESAGGADLHQQFDPKDLIRLEHPSPIRAGETVSLLEKGVYELDAEVHSQEYEQEFLSEGRPPNIYIHAEGDGNPLTMFKSQEDEERFKQVYMGSEQANNAVPILQNADIEPVSINPDDLNMLDSRKMRERRISQITGVPRALYSEDANRANVEGAKLIFSQYTIQPLHNSTSADLEQQFEVSFGADEGALMIDPANTVPTDEEQEETINAKRIERGVPPAQIMEENGEEIPDEYEEDLGTPRIPKSLVPINVMPKTTGSRKLPDEGDPADFM